MTLDEQIAIIQAVKDGKTVEIYNILTKGCCGKCTADHEFNFTRWRYEIQREPMEIWVNVYDTGWLHAFNHQADAARQSFGQNVLRTVKFREVLDGDNL